MDEKQTNDAKQVMLVQQADDGRIQAVTGMDSVGNLHTVEPTRQNVSNLLNETSAKQGLKFSIIMFKTKNQFQTA